MQHHNRRQHFSFVGATGAAYLEQDVGGVEIAVADTVGMHMPHAASNVCEDSDQALPPCTAPLQQSTCQRLPQAPAVGILLQMHLLLKQRCQRESSDVWQSKNTN